MSYLLLAALAAFVLYLGLRWFVNAEPARVVFVARALAISIAAVVVLLLVFTGRIGSLYMLGALLLPLAMAWYRRRKATAGGFGDPHRRRGGKSEIDTPWLHMELDLQDERIDGRVIQGSFAGKRLSDLEEEQLSALYRESGSDADTARLLEAYLDRRLGPAWRQQQERPQPARAGMSREEALEILGLPPQATADDIRAAHRRLMAQLHPDKGGSTYLAAKINQARDFLLGD
ncbi:MAG: DnaJ domain protein [Alphaproteobacteria bacterium]|jgi:hypothetical protein|nr:DnaJ domain protein [Alphaproteobacteria bacterium]